MLNLGLTGNIAAGKSEVTTRFGRWGASLIDADRIVRELQQPNTSVFRQIQQQFGRSVVRADGALDRARLRKIVMADDTRRTELNAIVHPAVGNRRQELLKAARTAGDCIVVSDIPLLFEVLDPADFDGIVFVDAPASIRRARLIQHRGFDAAEADRLMASQMEASSKRDRSDYVIDNSGTLDELDTAAWEVWKDLRKRAASREPGVGSIVIAVDRTTATWVALTGTAARYHDAGAEIGVVSVGDPTPAPKRLGLLRSSLHAQQIYDIPDPSADPDALAAVVRQHAPHVVIAAATGTTQPPNILHADLATTAWRAAGMEGRLVFAVGPRGPKHDDASSTGSGLSIDVRPWVDAKRSAGAAAVELACEGATDPSLTGVALGREQYRQLSSTPRSKHHLFAAS